MKYVAMAKAVCLYVFIVVYWALLIVLYSPVQLPVTLIAIWVEKTGEVHWRKWRYNLWIGQDQSLNALLGGDRDITLSSRIGWNAERGSQTALYMEAWLNPVWELFTGIDNHCRRAIERDEQHNKHWGA
ncbi:hypothetical protein [Bowmanella sp. JS7-9]|uniref:Toxin CptA n=1 Tax=Pseudobowmanella zhangzhouensis TaxID=1537679 RepID=A0ABW1XLS5_9ALTE|nr:hypothetical protein [Bowmanella sp. JS7-9]TBX21926.1 hypothetical protein TK45_10585 [Bowmanella sp. JS7-9]